MAPVSPLGKPQHNIQEGTLLVPLRDTEWAPECPEAGKNLE